MTTKKQLKKSADICIPTIKPFSVIKEKLDKIQETMTFANRIIVVSNLASASVNRNACINLCRSDIVIMIDDDVDGFYNGWDEDLVKPLIDNDLYMMVMGRPLKPDRSPAENGTGNMDMNTDLIDIPKMKEGILPSSIIAFYKTDIRFDENYTGACFEDGDFCLALNYHFPDRKFAINNKCKLIHYNEKKGYTTNGRESDNPVWKHNREYFYKKWHSSSPYPY